MRDQTSRLLSVWLYAAILALLFCLFTPCLWAACQSHTSTITAHVIAGRAYAYKEPGAGCDATVSYYAVDNDPFAEIPLQVRFLGNDPALVVSLYTDNNGLSYHRGECPPDNDGDGYHAMVDCKDDDPAIHPGAEEVCGDGVDQNCDVLDLPCEPFTCREFTATNQTHEDAGRISIMCTCACWYITKGSGVDLGNQDSKVITTLFTIDNGENYYVGHCPEDSEKVE